MFGVSARPYGLLAFPDQVDPTDNLGPVLGGVFGGGGVDPMSQPIQAQQPIQATRPQPNMFDVNSVPHAPVTADIGPAPKKKFNFVNFLDNFLTYYNASRGSPLGLALLRAKQQREQADYEAKQKEAERQTQSDSAWKLWQQEYDYKQAHPEAKDLMNVEGNVLDPNTGKVIYSAPGKPIPLGDGKVIFPSGAYGQPGAPDMTASGATPIGANVPPSFSPNTDNIFQALIQQESGGIPRPGPVTPYGRAQGVTQLLPTTAQGMAQKLGIPYQPSLLVGKTPEAVDYQTKLGRAYFDEGLQKFGGDVRNALLYYHGGPNQRLWGPKTNAYADAILKRVGAPAQPSNGQAQSGGSNLPPGWTMFDTGGKGPHADPGYHWSDDGTHEIPNAGGPQDLGEDQDTIQFMGQQVALGGQMPAMGMGQGPFRKAVYREAVKQWNQMGVTPGEANVIAATNKTGLQELGRLANMKAAIQTAENTASANADQVITLLGKAGTTGVPIFNRWQQAGRRSLEGDPGVSQFDVAVKTLANEYARVMTSSASGGGSQQLSDSARHEVDALLHVGMTPDQFRSAIKQMKIDMANRSAGIEKERQTVIDQIKTGRWQPPAAPATNGWSIQRH